MSAELSTHLDADFRSDIEAALCLERSPQRPTAKGLVFLVEHRVRAFEAQLQADEDRSRAQREEHQARSAARNSARDPERARAASESRTGGRLRIRRRGEATELW